MKNFILNITTPNTIISTLLMMGCLFFWIPSYLQPSNVKISYFTIQLPIHYSFEINHYLCISISLLLTLLNGFLLAQLVYKFNIKHTSRLLPVFIYLFTISVNKYYHFAIEEQLALMFFVISIFLVDSMFKQISAVEPAFLSSLLITCAAMFLPDIIWLIPMLWIAFLIERAASIRVYLASSIGILSVVIFWGIYVFVYDSLELFTIAISQIMKRSFLDFSEHQLEYVYIVLVVVFAFIGVISYFTNIYQENTKIRAILSSLTSTFIICTLLLFFQNTNSANLYIIMAFLVSLYGSYLFLSRKSLLRSVIFILMLVVDIAYFIF